MATLTSKIDSHDASIKSVIATSNDTLKNAINAKGCIKSIQRGSKTIYDMTGNTSTSIDISPINPNKSLLLINVNAANDNGPLQLTSFNLLQSTIAITNNYTSGAGSVSFALSYQVVEFY